MNSEIATCLKSEASDESGASSTFSDAARRWAIDTIESIANAGNSKTRLGTIKDLAAEYRALLDACLLVAWRKRVAYERARTGEPDQEPTRPGGWVLNDPELADAYGILARGAIPVKELSMLPSSLTPPPAHSSE